jgi:hypothetical protein
VPLEWPRMHARVVLAVGRHYPTAQVRFTVRSGFVPVDLIKLC